MGELPPHLYGCKGGQIWVVIGVIADAAALGPDPRGRRWVLGLAEAELEEGRCGMGRPQDVENGRCVLAGSVIKGQVDGVTVFPSRMLGGLRLLRVVARPELRSLRQLSLRRYAPI